MTPRSLLRPSPRAPLKNSQLWDSPFYLENFFKMKQRTLRREKKLSRIRSKETQSCLNTSSMITMRTKTFRQLKLTNLISTLKKDLWTWKYLPLKRALKLIEGNLMHLSKNLLSPKIWLIYLRINILLQVKLLDSPLDHLLLNPIREIKNQTLISKIQLPTLKVSNLPHSSSSWRSKLWSFKHSRLLQLKARSLTKSLCHLQTPPQSWCLINSQLKIWRITNLRLFIHLVKQFKFLQTLTRWFLSVLCTIRQINLYQNICISWIPRTISSCQLSSRKRSAQLAVSLTNQSRSETSFREIDWAFI